MLNKIENFCYEKEININPFPQLNENIDIDVLIIGGNITGALCSYIFHENHIKVALIDKGKIKLHKIINDHAYDLDEDIQKLSPYMSEYEMIEQFPLMLESVYKLDDIMDKLEDKCDYIRKPDVNLGMDYQVEHYEMDHHNYLNVNVNSGLHKFLPICSKFVSYRSGIELNQTKLMNSLYYDLTQKSVPIYENTGIDEINIDSDEVNIMTKNKTKIKCKKVIITDSYESLLFFDKPYALKFISQYSHLIPKYQRIDNEIKYHFDELMLDMKRLIPYINEAEEYPNIYFNIGMDSVLFSLMGALMLCDKYQETNVITA